MDQPLRGLLQRALEMSDEERDAYCDPIRLTPDGDLCIIDTIVQSNFRNPDGSIMPDARKQALRAYSRLKRMYSEDCERHKLYLFPGEKKPLPVTDRPGFLMLFMILGGTVAAKIRDSIHSTVERLRDGDTSVLSEMRNQAQEQYDSAVTGRLRKMRRKFDAEDMNMKPTGPDVDAAFSSLFEKEDLTCEPFSDGACVGVSVGSKRKCE
eukprot:jgi/Mesvir1/7777/Mv11720-RA.1